MLQQAPFAFRPSILRYFGYDVVVLVECEVQCVSPREVREIRSEEARMRAKRGEADKMLQEALQEALRDKETAEREVRAAPAWRELR